MNNKKTVKYSTFCAWILLYLTRDKYHGYTLVLQT